MADPSQIFAWAEQAVEEIVLDIDPALADRWRVTSPQSIGLDGDNWLDVSKRMIRHFNELAQDVTSISISEPARLQYRNRDLIEFVGAIADAAEQVS